MFSRHFANIYIHGIYIQGISGWIIELNIKLFYTRSLIFKKIELDIFTANSELNINLIQPSGELFNKQN